MSRRLTMLSQDVATPLRYTVKIVTRANSLCPFPILRNLEAKLPSYSSLTSYRKVRNSLCFGPHQSPRRLRPRKPP